MKQVYLSIGLALAILITGSIILEITLRNTSPTAFTNTRYGWARNTPATEHLIIQDENNSTRNVTITYFAHGFKRWGDPHTNQTKIFIIGDSFTEMRFVSNGEEWYSYLEKAYPQAEFFVYGAGGYGSLQEYLILQDYMTRIQPDIIIWQFYFNDYINNVFWMDKEEYPLNNIGLRPYLENGTIAYRIPAPLSRLRQDFRSIELVTRIYDKIRRTKELQHKDQFYWNIYGERFWDKDFRQAKIFKGKFESAQQTTQQILTMAKDKTKNSSFYLFSADPRLSTVEQKMSTNTDITYIPGVAEQVQEMQNNGTNTHVINDAHWNLAGNRIVGEYLVHYFQTTGINRTAG